MMDLNSIQGKNMIDLAIKVIGIFFPLLISYVIQYIRSDKNWRDKRRKSSFDKYAILQCKVFILFFLSICASAFLVLVIIYFMGCNEIDDISKRILGISIIINFLIYFLYIRNKLHGVIDIKKKYKKKYKKKSVKRVAHITCYSSFLVVGIVLFPSLFLEDDLIFLMGILLISFCIILEAIILDDVSNFKHKYISFICKGGWKLDGILNKNVYKKGSWMIVKLNSGKEVRFKYDDIIRIEYSKDTKTT